MATARPIRVDIIGNARGLSATVDIANAKLATMQKTAMQASAATDRLERNMNRANAAMAAAAGIAGAGIVFKQLADAAGRAETATLSINAVFKTTAAQMQEAAKAGNDVGMSFSQYGTNATRLGAQLQNMGFDAQGATDATQQLIKHAADLSAVFGGDATQAIEAMSAVFRKEMDPIEKYGVTMKAADIESRAAAEGISYGQAAIKAIMEQTGYAFGAFERNSDTYNVQMQKMAAATEDAKAQIGESLLPVFKGLASGATTAAAGLNAIPDGVRSALAGLLLLGGALKIATIATSAATARLYAYEAALIQTRGAGSATALSVGLLGTQMERAGRGAKIFGALMLGGLAADALVNFSDTADETRAMLAELADSGVTAQVGQNLSEVAGYMNTLADPTLNDRLNALAGSVFNMFGFQDTSRNRTIDAIKEFDSQLAALAGNGHAEAAAAGFDRLTAAAAEQGIPLEEVIDLLPQYTAAADSAAAGTQAVSDAAASSATEFEKAKDAADQLRDSLAALGQSNVDAALAQADYREAVAQFNAEVKKGAGINSATEGGRENLRGLAEIRDRTLDLVAAQRQAGSSGKQLQGTMRQGRDAFIAAAEAAGVGSTKAQRLARDWGLIPKKVGTSVEVEDDRALAAIAAVKAQLAILQATQYATTLLVQVRQSGSTPSGVPSPTNSRAALFDTAQSRAAFSTAARSGSAYDAGLSIGNAILAGAQTAANKGVRIPAKFFDEGIKFHKYFAISGDVAKKNTDKFKEITSEVIANATAKYERLYDRLKQLEKDRAALARSLASSITAFSISDQLSAAKTVADQIAELEKKRDEATMESWSHLDGLLTRMRSASGGELAHLQSVYADLVSKGPMVVADTRKRAEIEKEIAALRGQDTVAGQVQAQLDATRKFAAILTDLKNKGLSADMLAEIAQAGPEAGLNLAQALNANAPLLNNWKAAFTEMAALSKTAGQEIARFKFKPDITDARQDLRRLWRNAADDMEEILKEKLAKADLKVEVDVVQSTKPGGAKGSKAAAAPLIGSLTINGAVDAEGTARQIDRVLTQHARRMGY